MNFRKYIDQWLNKPLQERPNPDKMNRFSVRHNRWDRATIESLAEDVTGYRANQRKLGKLAPDNGETLFDDAFLSLYKAVPRLEDESGIRPNHLINRAVMEQFMDVSDYQRLWSMCSTDPIASANADITLRPKLEEILDRLQDEQDQANQIEQIMQEMMDLGAAMLDAVGKGGADDGGESEDDSTGGGGDGDEEGEGEGEESEGKSLEDMQKEMEALAQQLAAMASELDDSMDEQQDMMAARLQAAMAEAQEDLRDAESAAMMFGVSPGSLSSLDPESRMAIASKMNSDKFKRIAKLLGKIQPYALGEQRKKVQHIKEEIIGVERGDDIELATPDAIVKLSHPATRAMFLRSFRDGTMEQFETQGQERLAMGDIILCEDGSGSMGGAREVFAKAVAIALARIAHEQDREFTGIHFGSPGEIVTFEFRNRNKGLNKGTVLRTSSGHHARSLPDKTMSYVEGIVSYAELFFNGGTDFVTPLDKAVEILDNQNRENGCLKGDIVFVTDGYCTVPEVWLKDFIAERERLDFRVWGVLIGARIEEPLATICNSNIFTIQDLTEGTDLEQLFRAI